MLDLLTIGEAMAELRRTPTGHWAVGFAGDTFNTAVYCARALPQGRVGFHSRLGRDPLSDGFLDLAQHERIDTATVTRDAQRNIGLYSVSTDATGERSFHYWRDGSAARQMFAAGNEPLPPARVVLFSAITLAILTPDARKRLLRQLAHQRDQTGCQIAFDSNYRPRLWESIAAARTAVTAAWALADIALPSLDDEMALFGEPDEAAVLSRLSQQRWRAGALKRGANGPLPLTGSDHTLTFPSAAKIVDTTAAGDSFNGGFLAAYLQGADETACMIAGHQTAIQVIAHPGAITPRA